MHHPDKEGRVSKPWDTFAILLKMDAAAPAAIEQLLNHALLGSNLLFDDGQVAHLKYPGTLLTADCISLYLNMVVVLQSVFEGQNTSDKTPATA